MPKKVFMAGASCRSAAESANRAGFEVVAADLFGDRDLRACAKCSLVGQYPADIASIAFRVRPRTWMYTGGLENCPGLVATVSRQHELLGNGAATLKQVRDPQRLGSVVRQAGFLFPETRARPPEAGAGAWLRKPRGSCGGLNVRRWRSEGGERTVSAGRYWYQRRVRGPVYGVVYVAAAGEAYLVGVTRQLVGGAWTSAGRYQYVGSIGPVALGHSVTELFRRLGSCLASEFKLSGLFGVDVIYREQRCWVLEVNPRYTASVEIHERATSWLAFEAHWQACAQHVLPDTDREARKMHGKAIVYAREPTLVDADFCEQLDAVNDKQPLATFADLPHADTRVEDGQPILTTFAQGIDVADVLRRLRFRADWVRQRVRSCDQ